MSKNFPGCEDCWHNYHCSMPQEGYDYNPKECPWNPDNEKKKQENNKSEAVKKGWETRKLKKYLKLKEI